MRSLDSADETPACCADYVPESFFNRHALQEYILLAGQHPAGGLRDKPPKYVSFFPQSFIPPFMFYAGMRMPIIPRTVSPACRQHSIMCILHLVGERKCERRGKAKTMYVGLPLPSVSAGLKKKVAPTLSDRLRTE